MSNTKRTFARWWRFGLAAFTLAVCVGAIGVWARSFVSASTAERRYAYVAAVPERPVAIVFGAGLTPDGSPTPMLADRVQAALDLYGDGKVRRLLLSGDNSRPGYDEVSAMMNYALERGLPRRAMTLDYAGFDTYDSCYRARFIFGVRAAVLVTQNYHLPRALYDCTRLGIDAVGLGTPDWGAYDNGMMTAYEIREAIADLKSLWDVHVSRRTARVMGAYVGMR